MMKNKIVFIVHIIFLVLLLVSCKSGKAQDIPKRELTIMLREESSQPLNSEAPVIQALGEIHNLQLHIKGFPEDIYNTKKEIYLFIDNLSDITQVSRDDIDNYGRDGLFLPLNEYIHMMPNFKKLIEENPEIDKLYVDGVLYGFPVMTKEGIYTKSGAVIRLDVLIENKLKVPDSFDELYTTLKSLKEIYPDSDPFTVRGGTGSLLSHIAYSMGSGYGNSNNISNSYGLYYDADINQDGKYTYGPLKTEFKEMLIYLNKLYEEGLLDPDYNIISDDEWLNKILTGKSFFFYDDTNSLLGYIDLLEANLHEAEFAVIDELTNIYGYERNRYNSYHEWETQYAIRADIENPEEIIRLFDYLYSEEGALLTNYGLEQKHYFVENEEFKVLPEIIQKYISSSNQFKAMQSDLGTGRFAFCTYIDETSILTIHPDYGRLFKVPTDYSEPFLDPPLTEEEINRLDELREKINKILLPQMDKLIMGMTSFDQYDEVIRALEREGAKEIETIYNQALVRYYGW